MKCSVAALNAPRPALPACPLCRSPWVDPHQAVAARDYFRCTRCWLVFLDPAQRPQADVEAAYYRLHRNDIDDPGYRRFVAPLVDALQARLQSASAGLDFGCGPAPAVAAMLQQGGHDVRCYDPQFRPDAAALRQHYDFIVLSEVAEHLHSPEDEFARLRRLLKPGGILAVKTGFVPELSRFSRWHYLRDPTHVVFFSPTTFRWLAARLGLRCELPAPNVALLTG